MPDPIEPSDQTTDLAYVYTTSLRISRLLGYFGLQQWTDHDNSGSPDDEVIRDAIWAATAEMDMFLAAIYDRAEMVDCALVVDWCTKLAAYRVCLNRGNEAPSGLVEEIKGIREHLLEIKKGMIQIPGMNPAFTWAPTMSNRVVTRNYARKSVRIDKQTSTIDQMDLNQHTYRSYNYYLQ